MTIGEQIKKQREKQGMSQNDLRDALGLKSVDTIKNWENERVKPSIDTLAMMHELLGWEFELKL